jgi:hypothetical protein
MHYETVYQFALGNILLESTSTVQCCHSVSTHTTVKERISITHPSSAPTTSNTTSFYLEFNACRYLCPIQQTNWFSNVGYPNRILCIIINYFPHHHFRKVLTCSGLAGGSGGGGRGWRARGGWCILRGRKHKYFIGQI